MSTLVKRYFDQYSPASADINSSDLLTCIQCIGLPASMDINAFIDSFGAALDEHALRSADSLSLAFAETAPAGVNVIIFPDEPLPARPALLLLEQTINEEYRKMKRAPGFYHLRSTSAACCSIPTPTP